MFFIVHRFLKSHIFVTMLKLLLKQSLCLKGLSQAILIFLIFTLIRKIQFFFGMIGYCQKKIPTIIFLLQ